VAGGRAPGVVTGCGAPGRREWDRSDEQVAVREERGRAGARMPQHVGPYPGRGDGGRHTGRSSQPIGGERRNGRGGRSFRGAAGRRRQAAAAPRRGERERRVAILRAAAHRAQLSGHDARIRVRGLYAKAQSQDQDQAGGTARRHCQARYPPSAPKASDAPSAPRGTRAWLDAFRRRRYVPSS
jgi:hypothetical protein